MEQNDLQREIQAKLQEMPPADWVLAMIDHYRRTGTYRAKDLRRLLGDPNKGVEIGPNASIPSFCSASNDR
jgi:hypothetical protein